MKRVSFAFLTLAMALEGAVNIEKTAYKGWANCLRMSNGTVELIVTTDVGPRVIRYGFVGGQNLFKEFEEQLGKSGEKNWQPRGGHRIWIAPEAWETTYALDNGPVKAEQSANSVTLTQPVEPETQLEKQIVVTMAGTGSAVEVKHSLRNRGKAPREFAPWALTMMAQGGYGITGYPPRGTHPEVLAPTNPLIMWAFSDLSDPRWTFTTKYLVLKQDAANKGQPQKLGYFQEDTWGAYYLKGDLFLKRYRGQKNKVYPDMGCSYETFTNAEFLELETLGPLVNVPPGEALEHVERWSLTKGVKLEKFTDAELDATLQPLLR